MVATAFCIAILIVAVMVASCIAIHGSIDAKFAVIVTFTVSSFLAAPFLTASFFTCWPADVAIAVQVHIQVTDVHLTILMASVMSTIIAVVSIRVAVLVPSAPATIAGILTVRIVVTSAESFFVAVPAALFIALQNALLVSATASVVAACADALLVASLEDVSTLALTEFAATLTASDIVAEARSDLHLAVVMTFVPADLVQLASLIIITISSVFLR